MHPLLSFFIKKVDFDILSHCNNYQSTSKKLKQIKVLDHHFEKKKRLMIKATQTEDSFTGGTINVPGTVAEEPLCYDSEDEDLIETNKSPKNFLLIGRPCKCIFIQCSLL
jgi:hypothetical protein